MIGKNYHPQRDMEMVLKNMVPGHSDDWYKTIVREQIEVVWYYWDIYQEEMTRFLRGGAFRLKEEQRRGP